jgi:prepilin-type N-terminal cleavage/methylation domain-containing protein
MRFQFFRALKHGADGFTLAEILITLGLLGLIAAFAIPKLMHATGQEKTTSALRDLISTVSQAQQTAIGSATPGTTILRQLAAQRSCNTNATADNPRCWDYPATPAIPGNFGTSPAALFAAGSAVYGLSSAVPSGGLLPILLDANGGAGKPNLVGSDLLIVVLCVQEAACTNTGSTQYLRIESGEMGPPAAGITGLDATGYATNERFYEGLIRK